MANGKGHIDCLNCKYFHAEVSNPLRGNCELLEVTLPERGPANYVCVHFKNSNADELTQWPASLQFARFGKELASGVLYGYDYTSYKVTSENVLKLGPSGSGRWVEP